MTECKSCEEAMESYNSGDILSGGGYTFVKIGEGHFYTACGTVPGCLRGGAATDFTKSPWREKKWERLSVRDWICKIGFNSSWFSNSLLVELLNQRNEYLPLYEMCIYQVDSEFKYDDFADTFKSARIWKDYFKQEEKCQKN